MSSASQLYKEAYNAHHKEGDVEKAEQLYRAVLVDYPNSEEAKYANEQLKGGIVKIIYKNAYELHYKQEKFAEARATYEHIVASYPDTEEAGYAHTQLKELTTFFEKIKISEKEENELAEGIIRDQLYLFYGTGPPTGVKYRHVAPFDVIYTIDAMETDEKTIQANLRHLVLHPARERHGVEIALSHITMDTQDVYRAKNQEHYLSSTQLSLLYTEKRGGGNKSGGTFLNKLYWDPAEYVWMKRVWCRGNMIVLEH